MDATDLRLRFTETPEGGRVKAANGLCTLPGNAGMNGTSVAVINDGDSFTLNRMLYEIPVHVKNGKDLLRSNVFLLVEIP